jgi:hypothetical protein
MFTILSPRVLIHAVWYHLVPSEPPNLTCRDSTMSFDIQGDPTIAGQRQPGCGSRQPKYTKRGARIVRTFDNAENEEEREKPLMPEKALSILKNVTKETCDALGLSYGTCLPLFCWPSTTRHVLRRVSAPQL